MHEEHSSCAEAATNLLLDTYSIAQTVAELSDQRTHPGKEEQAQQNDANKELKKVSCPVYSTMSVYRYHWDVADLKLP